MGKVGTLVRRLARPVTSYDERRTRRIVHETSASADQLEMLQAQLGAWMARSSESEQFLGRMLSRITEGLDTIDDRTVKEIQALRDEISFLGGDVHAVMRVGGVAPPKELTLSLLGEDLADLLNRAQGYLGLAAQAGVFVNEPLIQHFEIGNVRISNVNERIAEVPFVLRESHRLPEGARVLDVGAAESLVSLNLASLGYNVTALDPRGYLLAHPNLTSVQSTLQDYEPDEPFDAALLVSMIEHVGIEHYDQVVDSEADFTLMAHLRELVRPGGLLLLTTPFGRAHDAGFQRIYDADRLNRLLDGWDLISAEVVEQRTDTEWVHTKIGIEPIDDDVSRVVMVVATRPSV